MLLLPTFGIDINPFLFLLTDLRFRYESDWFRVANNREHRWIDELAALFSAPKWEILRHNLRLREDGKDLTDIDFATYDKEANELAVMQLKWQHPVGMDNRGRRSAGKNLFDESNRWIAAVISWLERHGIEELMRRFGFNSKCSPKVSLFVLGRYHVHLSGFDNRDNRAIWSDWAHFRRICIEEAKTLSLEQLAMRIRKDVLYARSIKRGESTMFPVGNIVVVLNPTSVPPA